MSVPGVSSLLIGQQAVSTAKLSLAGGDDFSSKLELGQIIKGRVLRHYEGTRYSVDFGGRQKVVDSGVPLKTGDILHGKVVGLGERVELERVRGGLQPAAHEKATAAEAKFWGGEDSASKLVADLVQRYQGRLTLEQTAVIEKSVRGAADKNLMTLSGLLLAKLGVGFPSELLKAVYELLRTESNRGLFELAGKALEMKTASAALETAPEAPSEAPTTALAALLKELIEQVPAKKIHDNAPPNLSETQSDLPADAGSSQSQGSQTGSGSDLTRWLLNVQTGSSVAHRVNTIPLLINGRLLELNIAVFEQRDAPQVKRATKHRQLAFSLHSEQLGHVDAHLVLTGEHMKMTLGSDREVTAEWLARYSPELTQQLQDEGWHVDELNVEMKPAEPAGVARAVLQHVITQDSVNRLM